MTSRKRNADERDWHDLPSLYVRLKKTSLNYPPREWEELKIERTDRKDVFRIKSIPFYARGIALDDEVLATTSEEGYYPVFQSVVRRSGFSTMRLWLSAEEDQRAVIEQFLPSGTQLEFDGRLVALAIPRDAFPEVSTYVCDEKDKGRWGAEDGFIIIDQ